MPPVSGHTGTRVKEGPVRDAAGEADGPKRLVSEGYDRIHLTYAGWGGDDGIRRRYIRKVLERGLVPAGGFALDLGGGTGALGTTHLAQHFSVVAVDISKESTRAARVLLPDVRHVVADMASVSFRSQSFHLVTAFYSLIHVPRDEHPAVLAGIGRWLRPGGIAVLTMGAGDGGEAAVDDWLGAPMYWSNWDRETNIRIVREAGLRVLEARDEVTVEDSRPVPFLWVIAVADKAGVAAPG